MLTASLTVRFLLYNGSNEPSSTWDRSDSFSDYLNHHNPASLSLSPKQALGLAENGCTNLDKLRINGAAPG